MVGERGQRKRGREGERKREREGELYKDRPEYRGLQNLMFERLLVFRKLFSCKGSGLVGYYGNLKNTLTPIQTNIQKIFIPVVFPTNADDKHHEKHECQSSHHALGNGNDSMDEVSNEK